MYRTVNHTLRNSFFRTKYTVTVALLKVPVLTVNRFQNFTKRGFMSSLSTNGPTTMTSHSSDSNNKLRVSLLGYGAINSEVAKATQSGILPNVEIVSVLTRSKVPEERRNLIKNSFTKFYSEEESTSDDFFNSNWDVCVEAAGQPAVRSYAEKILTMDGNKRKMLVTSIGAFTNDEFWSRLCLLASGTSSSDSGSVTTPGPRLLLCSGAMPALDWISSAKLDMDTEDTSTTCIVTQTKPPISWTGTPAEQAQIDKGKPLESLTELTVLFEGTAREAATNFPKNSNVACTLALANGLGLDKTIVRLVTDPNKPGRGGVTVEYKREGWRSIKVETEETPSAENPKTSRIVPLSVMKSLKNLSEGVVVGM